MKNKKVIWRTLSIVLMASVALSLFTLQVFANDNTISIAGNVFEFDDKDHYEFDATKGAVATSVDNTYGTFSITGDLLPDTSADGIPSFLVNSGQVNLTYIYADDLLNKKEEEWHLVSDNSKKVNDITLDSNIKCGAVILQTSKDGEKWVDDV